MNVNPFSYLIEKLKGKLDKHTSYVGATDIDTVKAQGVYPLSQYNSNLPEIGSNKDWSTLYVSGNENDVLSQIFVSRGNRMFFRHCVSGAWGSWNELALKSDIFPTSLIGSPWGVTRRVTFSGKAQQSRASALLIPCGSVGIGAIIPITFRTDLNGDITKVYVASNTDGVIVDPDYDNAIRIPPVYNGWADYTIIKLYNDEAYTWTVSDV